MVSPSDFFYRPVLATPNRRPALFTVHWSTMISSPQQCLVLHVAIPLGMPDNYRGSTGIGNQVGPCVRRKSDDGETKLMKLTRGEKVR
jgi:hypothetical protein